MNKLGMVSGVAVVGCILLFGATISCGADWTLYYIDGVEKYYYDKSSVTHPRQGIVQFVIKKTLLDAQDGRIMRLELSCNYHTFRWLTDKVDPVTGEYLPEGAAGGYKWTWFPLQAPMMALYENLCE